MLSALAAVPAVLQTPKARVPLQFGATRKGRRTDAAMARWRNHRLGQILHFGLYSLAGGDWNGRHYDYAAEFIKESAKVSDAEYNALTARFQPSHDAPARWAALAKDMGARYVVITTKHHEGFCLWPSRFTDFSVATTPYRADFLGEYVRACDAAGLDVMLYYSILDWHHPDWRYTLTTDEDRAAFARFWSYCTNQLLELLERYPQTKGFWFDGPWDESVKSHGAWTFELEQKLRGVNPALVIGSRLRADETGARHFDANGELMGDYEQGWERKLPDHPLENDWECVMTVPENQWGYQSQWKGHVKDANELIEMMAQSVAYDGNFVLNIGPMGDGSIRSEEQALVRDIGAWMRVNGAAIHGCGRADLAKQDWGWFTKSAADSRHYAIVCNVPVSRALKVTLPKAMSVAHAELLDGKTTLRIESISASEQRLHLPDRAFTRPAAIALDLAIA